MGSGIPGTRISSRRPIPCMAHLVSTYDRSHSERRGAIERVVRAQLSGPRRRRNCISRRARAGSKRLSGGGDLVDEAIRERFPCVEKAPASHVLGDLLGGPAGAPGQAPVELPQELLLTAVL